MSTYANYQACFRLIVQRYERSHALYMTSYLHVCNRHIPSGLPSLYKTLPFSIQHKTAPEQHNSTVPQQFLHIKHKTSLCISLHLTQWPHTGLLCTNCDTLHTLSSAFCLTEHLIEDWCEHLRDHRPPWCSVTLHCVLFRILFCTSWRDICMCLAESPQWEREKMIKRGRERVRGR